MPELSGNTWLLLSAVTAGGALAVLHALATQVRNQVNVHDLRLNVARLRIDYAQRAKELAEASSVIEAIPIEEFEAAQKQLERDKRLVQEEQRRAA